MAEVRLRGITKRFGPVEVLHGVDLDVKSGEFVVFVGPSGCGKSTLLRIIAGLEEITSGTLEIAGRVTNKVPPAGRGIAMVFQSYALYPHMTVYENMAFGLKLARVPKPELDRRVRAAAEMLQLTPLLDRLPRQLSGGQRQRVAIGRAITRAPRVFLFDEPLSNLDAALRVATRVEIANLKDALPQTTMIYVTHDQVEAMTLADRIVVMNQGRIEQVGTPMELYERPSNLFVARFIGSPAMNIIPARVSGDRSSLELPNNASMPLPGSASALQAGQQVQVGIRPEHFLMEDVGPTITGRAVTVENLGEVVIAHLDIGAETPLVAKLAGTVRLRKGETINLRFEPQAMHLFDNEGHALPHN